MRRCREGILYESGSRSKSAPDHSPRSLAARRGAESFNSSALTLRVGVVRTIPANSSIWNACGVDSSERIDLSDVWC